MLQALSGLVRTAFPPNAQENRRQKVIKRGCHTRKIMAGDMNMKLGHLFGSLAEVAAESNESVLGRRRKIRVAHT